MDGLLEEPAVTWLLLLELTIDLVLLELLATPLEWLLLVTEVVGLLLDEVEDEAGLLLEVSTWLLVGHVVSLVLLLVGLIDALFEWLVLEGVLEWLLPVLEAMVWTLEALVEWLLLDEDVGCTLD